MKRAFLIIFFTFIRTQGLLAQTKEDSAKSINFPRGLYFDINNTGLMPPAEFEYDLSQNRGKSLIVGGTVLGEDSFSFTVSTLAKMMPQFPRFADSDSDRNILVIRWPENLMRSGTLEVISRSGASLWKTNISDNDILVWKNRLSEWQKKLKINPQNKPSFLTTQMGLLDWSKNVTNIVNGQDWFRFCLTQNEGPQFTRLCSSRYILKTVGSETTLAKQVITNGNVRVILRNEDAPEKGISEAKADAPLQFYADLANGMSYEFLALPPKLNIADLAETKVPNLIRVTGWDIFPQSPYRRIRLETNGKFIETIGFQSTIKDKRQFWEAGLQMAVPYFYFPGIGGGVFKQKFNLSDIPKENMRLFLQKNTPKGTYANSISLQGRKLPNATISSNELSAEVDSKDPTLFNWTFKSSEPGELNRSYLQEEVNGKNYRSYFEVYRSYSNEVSARMTAVYASNTLIMLGEVAYNHWFDNILGWNNYYLARQRWGLNFKYFKSLSALTVDTAGTKGDLDSTVLDLKYRLTPGLWTRDETVGAITSYQNINLGSLKAPMLGVGVFWARSMPQVFDRFFNLFPYMNYPKWVDVEFIYYTSPLAADLVLTSSYSLNFHGQVLWKKNLFGEAGFGIKRYAFSNSSLNQKAELNTFYGTLGIGLKF